MKVQDEYLSFKVDGLVKSPKKLDFENLALIKTTGYGSAIPNF
jgi:hypothetical protein